MKTAHLSRLFLGLFACLLAPRAFAQTQSMLLLVDVSNPAQVTITASTTNNAIASDDRQSFGAGVDLGNFFQSDASGYSRAALNSTLTTVNNAMPTYDSVASDNLTSDTINNVFLDLNIFKGGDGYGYPQTFTSGQLAFIGSITLDLSSLDPALLPTVGAEGDIYAGNNYSGTEIVRPGPNNYSGQTIIGQWAVVPEAGPGTLLLVGGALLLIGRQVRRRFAVAA